MTPIANPFQEITERLTRIETFLFNLTNKPDTLSDNESDKLLTVTQAGELLNLAVPTIYGLCHRSMIPVCKRGKRLYFSEKELRAWIIAGRRLTVDEIIVGASESLHANKKEGGKH